MIDDSRIANGLSAIRLEGGIIILVFLYLKVAWRKTKMVEASKEIVDKALEALEIAKATGKIKKGTNEVTKSLERGSAKLVIVAKDATPPEIVMHIPLLSEEKGVPCITVPSKEELGASAGIAVPTASAAITNEGEAKALLKEIIEKIGMPKKPEKKE